MSSSKKLPVKGHCGSCLSVWGPEPHTLFTQGRGEGGEELNQRRLEGQQLTKLGRKYQHD
jgi:hypothetical protein